MHLSDNLLTQKIVLLFHCIFKAKELSSSMKQARRVKMEQTNSIIALFIGMSRHEVDKQLDSPLFSSINIEEPLLTTDEKWINRLEQALKQAILGILLFQVWMFNFVVNNPFTAKLF